MNKSPDNSYLITIDFAVLLGFNIFYWLGKFGYAFQEIYQGIKEHFLLLFILQFLGVASLFVDLVVRWDFFTGISKRIRLILTLLLCGSFVIQLVMSILELYIQGEIL